MIEPSVGITLVRLALSNEGKVEGLGEKKFASIRRGEILAINEADTEHLNWVGKTGYWDDYKDSCRVRLEDGTKGALIPIKDVYGTETKENV